MVHLLIQQEALPAQALQVLAQVLAQVLVLVAQVLVHQVQDHRLAVEVITNGNINS